jgi:2-polyprenyl-3-methyl-5-hydroxy-6-metoxy-1,4-benzoquinol methylase
MLANVESTMNMNRIIEPELLDSLPSNDPRAIRSRKELRWINALMGNERWILQQLLQQKKLLHNGVIEWGAGEGFLCQKIHKRFPFVPITGIDLAARPYHISEKISWLSGNLLQMQTPANAQVIVANLFLHHLTDDQLRQCATWFQHASLLIFNEPLRKATSHTWGKMLHPLLESVTRHDMHVSIDAGFIKGELSNIWSDIKSRWMIQEWEQWPGAYRSVWIKK